MCTQDRVRTMKRAPGAHLLPLVCRTLPLLMIRILAKCPGQPVSARAAREKRIVHSLGTYSVPGPGPGSDPSPFRSVLKCYHSHFTGEGTSSEEGRSSILQLAQGGGRARTPNPGWSAQRVPANTAHCSITHRLLPLYYHPSLA